MCRGTVSQDRGVVKAQLAQLIHRPWRPGVWQKLRGYPWHFQELPYGFAFKVMFAWKRLFKPPQTAKKRSVATPQPKRRATSPRSQRLRLQRGDWLNSKSQCARYRCGRSRSFFAACEQSRLWQCKASASDALRSAADCCTRQVASEPGGMLHLAPAFLPLVPFCCQFNCGFQVQPTTRWESGAGIGFARQGNQLSATTEIRCLNHPSAASKSNPTGSPLPIPFRSRRCPVPPAAHPPDARGTENSPPRR